MREVGRMTSHARTLQKLSSGLKSNRSMLRFHCSAKLNNKS
jgi:hypothetical protein